MPESISRQSRLLYYSTSSSSSSDPSHRHPPPGTMVEDRIVVVKFVFPFIYAYILATQSISYFPPSFSSDPLVQARVSE